MAIDFLDKDAPTEKVQININDIESLTIEQVLRHLHAKNAERSCEACGAEDWVIDRDGERIAFTIAPLSSDQDAGLILLPLTCEACGNVRFLNAAYMAKMILSRGA